MLRDEVGQDLVVGIEYVLRLDDGEEVDRSDADEPLQYLHGRKNIFPSLERELSGLSVGDTKDIVLSPEEAYGARDSENIVEYERNLFPAEFEFVVGSLLELRDPDDADHVQTAIVRASGSDTVTLDFNHPLAGETLHFSVKVVSLRPATQEELAHGHVHLAQGGH